MFPATNLKPDYFSWMNETFSKGCILKGNYNLLLTKIQTWLKLFLRPIWRTHRIDAKRRNYRGKYHSFLQYSEMGCIQAHTAHIFSMFPRNRDGRSLELCAIYMLPKCACFAQATGPTTKKQWDGGRPFFLAEWPGKMYEQLFIFWFLEETCH